MSYRFRLSVHKNKFPKWKRFRIYKKPSKLNGTIAVYVDRFAKKDYAIVKYKGRIYKDAGIVYYPYIPGILSSTMLTHRKDMSVNYGSIHIINGILYIDGYGISDGITVVFNINGIWDLRRTGEPLTSWIYGLAYNTHTSEKQLECSLLTDWENRVKSMNKKDLILNSKHEFKYFRDMCVEKLKTS